MREFEKKPTIKSIFDEINKSNKISISEIDKIEDYGAVSSFVKSRLPNGSDKANAEIEKISHYKCSFQAAVFYSRLRNKTESIIELIPPKHLCLHIAVSLANIKLAKECYLKFFDENKHSMYEVTDIEMFRSVPPKNNKAARDLYKLFLHICVNKLVGSGLDADDNIFVEALERDFSVSEKKYPYEQYPTQAYGLSDCVCAYLYLLREDFRKYGSEYTKEHPGKVSFNFPLVSFYSNLPTLKYPRRYYMNCGSYSDFLKAYAVDLANEYPNAKTLALNNKDSLVHFIESLFLSEGISTNFVDAYTTDDATRLFASMASFSAAFGICSGSALIKGKTISEEYKLAYELAAQFYSMAIAFIPIIKSIKAEREEFYGCASQRENNLLNKRSADILQTQIEALKKCLSACKTDNEYLRENLKDAAAVKADLNKSVKDKDTEIVKLRRCLDEANSIITLYENCGATDHYIFGNEISIDKTRRIAIIGGDESFHTMLVRQLRMSGYENISTLNGKDKNFNIQNIKNSFLVVVITQWTEHSVINRVKKGMSGNREALLYTAKTNAVEIINAIEDRFVLLSNPAK